MPGGRVLHRDAVDTLRQVYELGILIVGAYHMVLLVVIDEAKAATSKIAAFGIKVFLPFEELVGSIITLLDVIASNLYSELLLSSAYCPLI